MTLEMTAISSFRATLSVAKRSRDELPIHMELCPFGSQGFISRGPVLQDLEPRNHPGEAFSSLRPDLDDEILDFKLTHETGNVEGRHENILHVWVFELSRPEGRLWLIVFSYMQQCFPLHLLTMSC